MKDNYIDYATNSARWLSLENFEGEIWKDIPNYEHLYKVSNLGRICSLERTSTNYNKITKQIIKVASDNGRGYKYVTLSKNGIMRKLYVHRIVAVAFIPNPLNFPTINHRDENKSNNAVSNLEWCSYDYNNKYGTAMARAKKTRRTNGNIRPIDMYDLKGTFLKHYECTYDVERDGLSRRCIYDVCNGRSRSYHGCVFRFSGEPFSFRETDTLPKGKKKEVIKKDRSGKLICIYPSIKAAERENGFPRNFLYSQTYASTRRALINGAYYEIKK